MFFLNMDEAYCGHFRGFLYVFQCKNEGGGNMLMYPQKPLKMPVDSLLASKIDCRHVMAYQQV